MFFTVTIDINILHSRFFTFFFFFTIFKLEVRFLGLLSISFTVTMDINNLPSSFFIVYCTVFNLPANRMLSASGQN